MNFQQQHDLLPCCRFFGYLSDSVFQDVKRRQVALTPGRFVQQCDGAKAAPALQFQLERHGPRFDWLQLLDRFLARCVPCGFRYRSFLRLHDSTPRRPRSRRKVARTYQGDGAVAAEPGAPASDHGKGLTAAQAAREPLMPPAVWVSLPRGFQPNPQQPLSAAGGYCIGHLPRITGVSICLLMSGAASSYYFELPRLQLVLSTNRADRTAEARLELCQIRPVLRPGVRPYGSAPDL